MSHTPRLRRTSRRYLTIDVVWAVVVIGGLFLVLQQQQIQPNDFWWHLRLGELIVESRAIPSVEPFAFTIAGERWVDQPWLAQVVLHATYETGGTSAILLLHAASIATGYALILLTVRPQRFGRAGAIAVLVGVLVGSMNWAVRPQMFSFLLFGALIYLIESHRHGDRRRLWLAVPLFAVWANTHGVFSYGIAVLGVYVTSQLVRAALDARRGTLAPDDVRQAATTAAIGLLSLVALAATPFTPLELIEPQLSQSAITQHLGEWQRLSLTTRDGAFVLASVVAFAALAWRRARLITPDQWLLLALSLLLTLYIRRAAVWYGMLLIVPLATLIADHLRYRQSSDEAGNRRLNAVLIATVVVAAVAMSPAMRDALPRSAPLLTERTPVAASAALCEIAPSDARVYQDFVFASYQIWACPRLMGFADTRLYPFPDELWDDYRLIARGGEGWSETLDRYAVTHLLLSAQAQPLAVERARAEPCWNSVYRDTRAEIFERSCPPG